MVVGCYRSGFWILWGWSGGGVCVVRLVLGVVGVVGDGLEVFAGGWGGWGWLGVVGGCIRILWR